MAIASSVSKESYSLGTTMCETKRELLFFVCWWTVKDYSRNYFFLYIRAEQKSLLYVTTSVHTELKKLNLFGYETIGSVCLVILFFFVLGIILHFQLSLHK